ncbi:hypothetical protein OG196_03470 [Kitasatospora purpeofusca]|uniref:hypothetical protein n=1 Tax=Kitasatospora purpeofusca TaxID=67352 RepID=UPI002E0F6504|nr:hypothetical protein OG715_02890 [Kitasatospora purpeofusca]WSR38213.1 hypothetical protein OG196_03470 [Kitasatospora purpeofusca]
MLTLRLIRREARIAWPVSAVLALLAALLTAVPLSWPPRFDRLAADTLADRVVRAQRDVPLVSAATTTVPLDGLVPPDTGSLDRDLDRLGERVRTAAGPGLAAVLGRPQARVTTLDVSASGPELPSPYGKPPRFALVYAQPDGPGGTVEYLQGRAPRQPGAELRVPPAEAVPVEVAVSEGTRERLGLAVGRRFDLSGRGWTAPVVLVGVFRTDRGAGRLWQQSPMLVSPWTVAVDPGQELNGQLLTSADGIETIAKRGLALKVAWELPTATDRSGPAATPAGTAAMQSALRALRAAGPDRLCGSSLADTCMLAGQIVPSIDVTERLGPELDTFAVQRRRTEQLQGFALAGLLAMVVATAVAAARLGARRRAGAFALQLSRGAGLPRIAGRLLAEAAVAVGAGVAAGWAVGRALAPPGAALGSPVPALVAAVLVWCAPAAVLLASAGRTRPAPRSRRIVLEALVVLLAAAGLVALRTRGAYAGTGTDPLLALSPVLLALVTVGVLLRLLPPLVRRATRSARRSRGLVPLVALARAGAQSGAAALSLLVLVLAMGYGVYGGLIPRTLADGQTQTADRRTGGAPVALVGPKDRLSDELPPVPALGHRVTVTGASGELTAQDDGTTFPGARFVGLDAAALGAADPSSPVARALLAAAGADAAVGRTGTGGDVPVLTALADPALAARFPDGTFELTALGTGRSLVHVVGALPEEALRDPVLGPVLGGGPRSGALLVFTGPSAERLPAQKNHASALLLYPAAGGPPLDPAAVRAAAGVQLAPTGVPGPQVELRDRGEELNALRADGLARSARLAFRATTALGLLLALGTFALDLLLSATERARTTSYLRTLGIGSRAVLGLQLLQLLPLVLAAAVGGTALGLLLPAALGSGLRLGALTGGPFEPAVHIDWTITAGLGLALVVVMTAAAVLEAAISRRRGLGAVLRLGEAL